MPLHRRIVIGLVFLFVAQGLQTSEADANRKLRLQVRRQTMLSPLLRSFEQGPMPTSSAFTEAVLAHGPARVIVIEESGRVTAVTQERSGHPAGKPLPRLSLKLTAGGAIEVPVGAEVLGAPRASHATFNEGNVYVVARFTGDHATLEIPALHLLADLNGSAVLRHEADVVSDRIADDHGSLLDPTEVELLARRIRGQHRPRHWELPTGIVLDAKDRRHATLEVPLAPRGHRKYVGDAAGAWATVFDFSLEE